MNFVILISSFVISIIIIITIYIFLFKKEEIILDFKGIKYRDADHWKDIIPLTEDKPINYLEIGVFHGANIISIANSYGKHTKSKLYCIDPFIDYKDFKDIYRTYMYNIKSNGVSEKITTFKGFSKDIAPKLDDNFFDIIYIDGDHEPESALEDAVISFRKLKIGGYMIFDDYEFGGSEMTQKGIDAFVSGYHKRIKILNINYQGQSFIQKIK